jgi:hypothetical protein
MMEAVCTSETSVDNNFTWQYIPEDHSEHHTRRHENLKSQNVINLVVHLSLRRGPDVFMNVAMWEHGAFAAFQFH